MQWTLLLMGVFLLQEPISANAVVLEAYQHGYHVWLIHLLFVGMTLFDIVVGYSIGKLIHGRFAESRLAKYIGSKMSRFSSIAGKNGQRIAIMLYGPIIFPLSAILAPWLGIGFWDALIFMFLGELLLWYPFVWVVVLGVKTFIPDPAVALYAVLGVSLLIIVGRKYMNMKKKATEASKAFAPTDTVFIDEK